MSRKIENLYTFQELINMPENEDDWLVEDLIPRGVNVGLVGKSESCKSTLLRQLALSINLRHQEFLGYKLDVKSGNVLYINTEESWRSVKRKVNFQHSSLLGSDYNVNSLPGETYVYFENHGILEFIKDKLEEIEVDLIIIDGFADIFSGDINSSSVVRNFLSDYSNLANSYDLSIIFMHHPGKGCQSITMDSSLGSKSFVQKLRSVLAIERKSENYIIYVVKHNDIVIEKKQKVDVLELGEDLILRKVDHFIKGGARAPHNKSKVDVLLQKYPEVINDLVHKKCTFDEAIQNLEVKNYKVSRGTLAEAKNRVKNK